MFVLMNAADSAVESTESDDEFQICEICNAETVLLFDILRWLDLLHYVTYPLVTFCRKERNCSTVPVVANWSMLNALSHL